MELIAQSIAESQDENPFGRVKDYEGGETERAMIEEEEGRQENGEAAEKEIEQADNQNDDYYEEEYDEEAEEE